MILILSRQDDGSTTSVIEWLSKFNKNFIRINTDDSRTKFEYLDIDKKIFSVLHEGSRINLFDCSSIWHRRRGFSLKNIELDWSKLRQKIFFDTSNYQETHINSEFKVLTEYFHYILENGIPTLGNYKSTDVNKLTVLDIAKKNKLKVPKSFVITTKRQLEQILNDSKKSYFITKSIGQGIYHFTDSYGYYTYTERIKNDSLKTLPSNFFPSLIQEEVIKKYELRIFYLKGKFYSMAIFSQNKAETIVDFRKYSGETPQRKVPYSLPYHIQQSLKKTMEELELDTGSIDMIVSKNNEYVFLEVNPVGQFGMTSLPCNYYLEKKIAETL
jgi:ATP-GRASP peptide maturase of grasp-with-spasm system